MAVEKVIVELDPDTFGIEPNVGVMHQVVNAQLAARRSGTHKTKTRSEVAGGGAKPWKQFWCLDPAPHGRAVCAWSVEPGFNRHSPHRGRQLCFSQSGAANGRNR